MFGKYNKKTIVAITSAIVAFVLAYLAYNFLANFLFQIGLISFRQQMAGVPTMCDEYVVNSAAAFSGVFDYVGLVVAAAFIIFAAYLAWRAFSSCTTE